MKRTVVKAQVDRTVGCKCMYPCIPMKSYVEAQAEQQPQKDPKQIHCALTDSPGCQFQCETQEEMKQHIEIKHRSKTHLQCTVCDIVFRNLDNLSTHMNLTHKKTNEVDMQYSCRSCHEKFITKN